MKYKHLFFDLDKTLWDFETNSSKTLNEFYTKYTLIDKGVGSPELFIGKYHIINDVLWDEYRKDLIDKETLRYQRFHRTLSEFNINDKLLSTSMSEDYIVQTPSNTSLFPYTYEVLDYLQEKYSLHIITNGFEETQHVKLKNCELKKYFKEIITSERAGSKKPARGIFDYSLTLTNAASEESLMIGDDLVVDMLGAKSAGIDQIYFNPKKLQHNEHLTYEIRSLKELMLML